jgi:hypothetical protein
VSPGQERGVDVVVAAVGRDGEVLVGAVVDEEYGVGGGNLGGEGACGEGAVCGVWTAAGASGTLAA